YGHEKGERMVDERIDERKIIASINTKTAHYNLDNISRTMAYLQFYRQHKEIWWALLASFVSRNAGWNMTDLKSDWYRRMLNEHDRYVLFLSYERANWLIFADAYPQLLLYELSKKYKMNLFYLLKEFQVSAFMQKEWSDFLEKRKVERLTKALIINEQYVIQKP